METHAGSTTQAPALHVALWDLAWRSTPNGNYESQREFSSQPNVIRNIQVPLGRCWAVRATTTSTPPASSSALKQAKPAWASPLLSHSHPFPLLSVSLSLSPSSSSLTPPVWPSSRQSSCIPFIVHFFFAPSIAALPHIHVTTITNADSAANAFHALTSPNHGTHLAWSAESVTHLDCTHLSVTDDMARTLWHNDRDQHTV